VVLQLVERPFGAAQGGPERWFENARGAAGADRGQRDQPSRSAPQARKGHLAEQMKLAAETMTAANSFETP